MAQVTVNPISSTYVGTGITRRNSLTLNSSTAKVLASAGYYSSNTSITLPNIEGYHITPSATSQIAVSAYKWTTGDVIVDAIPTSTILSSAINGQAFLEDTNDWGFSATITIPEGYYSTTTLTRSFSEILPSLNTQATTAQVLAGYEVYDGDGHIITGSIPTNGSINTTLTSTVTSVTIPAGYYSQSGTVSHTTVVIPVPTFSIASGTGVITASGAWTRGFTTNSTYTNTYTLTTQAGTTITPTEAVQTAVASYRWTTGTVSVAAISANYVGTGITKISAADVTVAGQSVTAPAGYYSSAITKAVTVMTLPTALTTTSTGTVVSAFDRSTATRYLNIPVGYNTTSRFYTINSVPNGTVTAPTTISSTAATVTTGTNTLTLSKTISVTPNVTTAGYISAGTAGNATVTLTANVTTKSAATITPGTTDQTIASGTYLTGTQTISGDADLVSGNIRAGVNIFGVAGNSAVVNTSDATATAADILEDETAYINGNKITGTMHVITYYVRSSAPTSSLGIDGDICLLD